MFSSSRPGPELDLDKMAGVRVQEWEEYGVRVNRGQHTRYCVLRLRGGACPWQATQNKSGYLFREKRLSGCE